MQKAEQNIITQAPETLPAVMGGEKTLIQQMLEAAKDIDVDKLKVLQEMHERAQDREAKRLFAIDFVKMKAHLPKIIRLKENKQTNSKYAPLEDINSGIDKILEEHGFGTMQKIIKTNAEGVEVNVRLWHRDGHFEEVPVWMPIDDKGIQGTKNKTLPHAIKSAVTYARTTGLCALLNISTGDDDGNNAHASINDEQAAEIKNGLRETGLDVVKFCKNLGAETVEQIRARDYGRAITALDAKRYQLLQAQKKAGANANPA